MKLYVNLMPGSGRPAATPEPSEPALRLVRRVTEKVDGDVRFLILAVR